MAGITDMQTSSGSGQLGAKARETAEQAKQKVSERLGEHKGSFARELHEVAQALRHTAEQYKGGQAGTINAYARQAADGIDRFGEALDRKNVSDMFADFERLCRERPLVVGAAAVIAGFVGVRLARSASGGRRESEPSDLKVEIAHDTSHEPDPRDLMRSEGGI
jgi:hypothetical protein